jgi:N-acetylmuramoyl-L-alanine amidase
MKILYSIYFISVLIFLQSNFSLPQVKGLSGWNIFLDPGHSQNENVGIFGYSEAKKVLQVGLNLRQLLLSNTDIDTVYISRTNEQEQVSLSQRTDYANSVGAAWYHSIHSDATSASETTQNSTLLLWGQYENGQEKIPNGGKAMSDVIVPILTSGYRTNTRGSWGDHDFYGRCPSTRRCPYLYVNYYTNMPSELSEAGFHTNRMQNQLNMNTKWKRLEAYTLYWSILKFFNIDRPFVGITTGIISDSESGVPINGAAISLNGQADTTDTYESLFHLYSNDPEELHNGFYFFENLPSGALPITVAADGYEPYSGNVSIVDTFFTFKDIKMISSVPPYIVSISPIQNDSIYPGYDNIQIVFSRPMDKASVESTLVISPPTKFHFIWSDSDRKVSITSDILSFDTNYQMTLSGNASDKFNHLFDGDSNGTGGDDYILNFKTKVQDFSPPFVVDIYPADNETGVESQPIISLSFNEEVNTATLSGKVKLVRDLDQSNASVIFYQYLVDGRSAVNLFPVSSLANNEYYSVILSSGYEDNYGNKAANQYSYTFKTGNAEFSIIKTIDNFENGISNWFTPQHSDSTKGIISEATSISSTYNYANHIIGGSKSMKLAYEWDTTAFNWLINEHYSPVTANFNSSNILQAYLFGDGSGNKFRFTVIDNTSTVEVSPWYTINWIGWKLINWDMTADGTGSWVGDGVLDNPLTYDGFQLTFVPGHKKSGELYFDDIRVVNKILVDVKNENNSGMPSSYSLGQNFPNPFNPTTQIKFGIPQSGIVKLEIYNLLGQKISTLVEGEMNAGYHSVKFDAKDFSSGIYIYTLSVNNFKTSKKMILLK